MKTRKTHFGYIAMAFAAFTLLFSACSEEEDAETDIPSDDESTQYIVGASVDEGSYLVVSDDLINSEISVQNCSYLL